MSPLKFAKPRKKKPRPRRFGSSLPVGQKKRSKPRKPLAKVGKQKPKREARNRAYYASPEWRAKRKAVFERDGYRCTESVEIQVTHRRIFGSSTFWIRERCPNRGEVVNGKQTARGLVAEEKGYQHRGIPDAIDRIVTRCRECDRRLTPLERVNHSRGFNNSHRNAS